jgi:hypothetical protein
MDMSTRKRKFGRKKSGSAQIAEFGPAIFILICCVMIPLIDLLYLGYVYAVGWYCNQMMLREVTCGTPPGTPPTFTYAVAAPGTDIQSLINSPPGGSQLFNDMSVKYTTWAQTMAVLCHGSQKHCWLYQTTAGTAPNVYVQYSVVTSQIEANPLFPFLSSWLGNVPGVGANITFNYCSQGIQEEKGLN